MPRRGYGTGYGVDNSSFQHQKEREMMYTSVTLYTVYVNWEQEIQKQFHCQRLVKHALYNLY